MRKLISFVLVVLLLFLNSNFTLASEGGEAKKSRKARSSERGENLTGEKKGRRALVSSEVSLKERRKHPSVVGSDVGVGIASLYDNIPGISLPSSPVNDTLDEFSDSDDVFKVYLSPGQKIEITLNGEEGTDFDLFLYPPGSTDVTTDTPVVTSENSFYPDKIGYTVPAGAGGYYYVDVYAYEGVGFYTLTYKITTSDDNIPGVALPSSPVNGTLDEDIDLDDVFKVYLSPGQKIEITLNGEEGTDFDLFLYPPGSTDVTTDTPVVTSENSFYPDKIGYTVPAGAGGYYYVDVYAYEGYGYYTLTYKKTTSDDNIPGVAPPASPVSDTLDEDIDLDDVYAVYLEAGDTIEVTLTADSGTDFDLYLYPPGSTDVETDDSVAESTNSYYPDALSYTVNTGEGGYYYLDVYCFEGYGIYNLSYKKTSINRGSTFKADVNGDGKDDVVSLYNNGNKTSTLFAFISSGTAFTKKTFWKSSTGAFDFNRAKLSAGDVNKDGKADAIVLYDNGNKTSTLFAFISSGTAFTKKTFWKSSAGAFDATRAKLSAGDVNKDGRADAIVLYDRGGKTSALYSFISNGSSFTQKRFWLSSTGAFDFNRAKLSAGDVNKDGKFDAIVLYNNGAKTSTLFAFVSSGTAFTKKTFWKSSTGAFDFDCSKLSVGDVNKDGKWDAIILYDKGSKTSALYTFISSGTSFTKKSFWLSPAGGFDWAKTLIAP